MARDWDDFKGRVKEATGTLADDDDLQREGKVDQIKSKVDAAVEEFTDKVRSFFD